MCVGVCGCAGALYCALKCSIVVTSGANTHLRRASTFTIASVHTTVTPLYCRHTPSPAALFIYLFILPGHIDRRLRLEQQRVITISIFGLRGVLKVTEEVLGLRVIDDPEVMAPDGGRWRSLTGRCTVELSARSCACVCVCPRRAGSQRSGSHQAL